MANMDGLIDSFVGSKLSLKGSPSNSNLQTCIVTAVVGTDSHLNTDSCMCEKPVVPSEETEHKFDQTCMYTRSKQDIFVMRKEGQISPVSHNVLKRNSPESFAKLQKNFSKTNESVKTSVNSNSEVWKVTALKNSKKWNSNCNLKVNVEQCELKTVSKVMEGFQTKNTTPALVSNLDGYEEKFFDTSNTIKSNILNCQNVQSISCQEYQGIKSNRNKDIDNFSQGLKLPTQGVSLSEKLPCNDEVQENKKQTIKEGTETTRNGKPMVLGDVTTQEKLPSNNDVSDSQISVLLKTGKNDSLVLSCEGKDNISASTSDQECSYIDTCYENLVTDEAFNEMIRKAGFPAVFQDKVVIGKYIPVRLPKQKHFKLRKNEALLQCPTMITPLLLKKADKFPTQKCSYEMSDSASCNENDKQDENDYHLIEKFTKKNSPVDFLSSSSCKFLLGIGLSQAQEWCLKHQIKYKKRQIRKKGMMQKIAKDLELYEKMLKEVRSANAPFVFPLKKCEFCDFKTESVHALEEHCTTVDSLLRKEYKCHFCGFCTKDSKALLFHIEALHNRKGKIDSSSSIYFCTHCPFETNNKKNFKRHLNKCQKQRHGYYLSVQDTPAKSSMLTTMDDIKDYEKYLLSCRKESTHYSGISQSPKKVPPCNQKCCAIPFQKVVSRPQSVCYAAGGHCDLYQQRVRPTGTWCPTSNNLYLNPYPSSNIRPLSYSVDNSCTSSCNSGTDANSENSPSIHIPFPANQIYQLISDTGKIIPVESGNSCFSNLYAPQYTLVSNSSGTRLVVDNSTPNPSRIDNISEKTEFVKTNSSNIVPTRLQGPHLTEMPKHISGEKANSEIFPSLKNTFVICEICDGYVKQLGHLRSHMYLIHKVEIQPKILQNRPPLNCQKCQWRFFTDQGLERHLLGAHGLVTTNLQELAKKKMDGGTCTICGRVYFSQLLVHMSQKHKIKLKPANLSYKCTVCSAHFNFYGQFQTHVYSAHIGTIKKNTADT